MGDSGEISTWSVVEAKARFSELLDRVRMEGPQRISRNGKAVAILVRPEAWRPPEAAGGFAALYAAAQDVGLTDAEADALFVRDLSPGVVPLLE